MYVQQPNSQAFSQLVLLQALTEFPSSWVLTPVNGKKIPYRQCWQSEQPVSHEEIAKDIRSGKAKGVGLRTGRISGGIIAIDADGPAAHEKILELSNGEALPNTVAFSSNRPGRCQYLFYIPPKYWEAIHTTKIPTGIKDDNGKEQKLELRWNGCQSVLPPSAHPSAGVYQWRKSFKEVAIAPAPMWIIEAMLLETEPQKPEQYRTAYTAKARSGKEWSNEEWALSYLSALNPCRADDYEDWVAVGMALHSVNDSLLTEWDNWSRQSLKYKPGDCEKKWKSFKRQGVAIGSLGHMAKLDGWRSPVKPTQHSSRRGNSGGSGSGGDDGSGGNGGGDENKILHFPKNLINIDNIKAAILEWLQQDLPGSSEAGFQIDLRNRYPFTTEREIKKLIDACKDELETEQSRPDQRDEIENLIQLGDQSLTLSNYLPACLASPLNLLSSLLNIRPEVALTSLLVGASSLNKTATTLTLHRRQGFSVPPSIYGALVAESGQKKSPILKALINKPLGKLQQEKRLAFQAALEKYEKDISDWDKCKSQERSEKFPDGKPKKPRQRLYYFTNATGEGLLYQMQSYPDNGMLALVDELAGLFANRGKYSNGRGSDRQDMLSAFDGTGATVLRADGTRADLAGMLLSVYGSIQPQVLSQLMQDCTDPDGQWARFLFVNQPLAAAELADDGEDGIDLTDLLTRLYRDIDELPAREYRLSHAAFKRYQPVYNQLEKLRVSHPAPGMRAVYSKMEGYIGRLALNLHIINSLMTNQIPDEYVSLETMEKAIALAKFYIGQVKLIHANSDSEELAPHIIRLRDASKLAESVGKSGWIHNRAYLQNLPKNLKEQAQRVGGKAAEVVRSWMREAEAMGIGRTRGTGAKLEYHWRCDNSPTEPPYPPTPTPENKFVGFVGDCRSVVGQQPTAETPINKEVDHFVGFVGQFSTSSTGFVEKPEITNMVISNPPQIQKELGIEPTEPTKFETTAEQGFELVGQSPTSRQQNLQLQLLTTIAILDIISIETEPYFESEQTISGVVTVCSFEETWEGIQRTFELVELSENEKQEVKRRLVELGHGAKIRQLYEQSQQKAAQPERLFKNGDRVQFQHWYGRFAAYVKSGCLVEWDKMPKSLLKMYGKAPTQPIAESELVLIKRASVLPEK
jgi:hypothetical protein